MEGATVAQQQHSSAQTRVTVNRAAVVSSGTVAQALAALAGTAPADVAVVTPHGAVEQALLAVQSCALDGDAISWSIVRRYDLAPNRRARDPRYRRLVPGVATDHDAAGLSVDGGGRAWAHFGRVDGDAPSTFSLAATPLGGGDHEISVAEGSDIRNACDGVKCAGCDGVGFCDCVQPVTNDPR